MFIDENQKIDLWQTFSDTLGDQEVELMTRSSFNKLIEAINKANPLDGTVMPKIVGGLKEITTKWDEEIKERNIKLQVAKEHNFEFEFRMLSGESNLLSQCKWDVEQFIKSNFSA